MNYWLVKSEPFKYSWDQFLKDKVTFWDGVRNYQARNNLKDMRTGDLCMFYHSNEGKEIVGIAEVVKQAYQDPTTEDPRWVVVDFKPNQTLKSPVGLDKIRQDAVLQNIGLIRQTQLSVMPLNPDEFNRILMLSEA
jgi:predicted RNA-binding protein with PUA-like domain